MDEEPIEQPEWTILPHGAFLMVWELVRMLQDKHPALYAEYFQRLKTLSKSEIGIDNVKSMDLIFSVLDDPSAGDGEEAGDA